MQDSNLMPINNQGANWDLLRSLNETNQLKKGYYNEFDRESNSGGLSLANEIKNQMLYFKLLQDKHDKSLINTLQDLNKMFKTG